MAVLMRVKRVTDPLDDEVIACICGKYHRKTAQIVTGGIDHESEEYDCPHLSKLINNFLEENDNPTEEDPSDSDDDNLTTSRSESTDMIKDLLHPTATNSSDSFRTVLYSQVTKAIEIFSWLKSNKTCLQRKVMMYLRESGYNAGICKTKWESSTSGGLKSGNYEFIDVVRSYGATCQQIRYIVDVEFGGEFEIVRPTIDYERLLSEIKLPRVYVGRCEELKRIVRVICDAAKRSYQRRELHLPPWRKNRYMQAKWFGPYSRDSSVVNQISSHLLGFKESTVKCRCVGFDAVNDG